MSIMAMMYQNSVTAKDRPAVTWRPPHPHGVRPEPAPGRSEIEAFAHAARALVACLPAVPWPEAEDGRAVEARLSYDRMPVLVEAVADAARRARLACHERLRELAFEPAAPPAP
jgi:hypothetical protein